MTVLHNKLFAASACFGLICCLLQSYAGYFALYLFFCQITLSCLVERLDQEKDKNNKDNAKSVKNHIGAFQALQQKYEMLMAKNSKLEKEHTTLQQNHEKLVAENYKLLNASKTLHSDVKGKSSSKRKVLSDKVSPRTVDINLSGPCQEPLSALCASFKEEDDDLTSEDEYSGSENSCSSNNDESTDSDDSYPPSVSDDQDIDDYTYGYKEREFLTFYVGNLHYSANGYQVKKAVGKAIGPCVDQVVIAKTSAGESRGCAFVTIRWKDYVQNVYDQCELNIEEHARIMDKLIQKIFCRNFQGVRICGRRVICQVAQSQRRD